MTPTDKRSPEQRLTDDYHLKRQMLAEEHLLPAVGRGDWWAVRNLLELLSEVLADGSSLTPECAAYLSRALQEIADGADHKEAFNIRRQRGEKDHRETRGRAFMNAYRIEYLRMEYKMALDEARHQVEQDTGIKDGALHSQWKEYHKSARRELEQQQELFGQLIPIW